MQIWVASGQLKRRMLRHGFPPHAIDVVPICPYTTTAPCTLPDGSLSRKNYGADDETIVFLFAADNPDSTTAQNIATTYRNEFAAANENVLLVVVTSSPPFKEFCDPIASKLHPRVICLQEARYDWIQQLESASDVILLPDKHVIGASALCSLAGESACRSRPIIGPMWLSGYFIDQGLPFYGVDTHTVPCSRWPCQAHAPNTSVQYSIWRYELGGSDEYPAWQGEMDDRDLCRAMREASLEVKATHSRVKGCAQEEFKPTCDVQSIVSHVLDRKKRLNADRAIEM